MARLALCFLLLASTLDAKPWYRDWRNWAIIGGSIAASSYATNQIHNCRARNDLIHCPDGGYGEFRARELVRLSTSVSVAALSVYGRQHWTHGWRNELINDAPATAWAGWNIAVGHSDQTTPTYPRYDAGRLHVKR